MVSITKAEAAKANEGTEPAMTHSISLDYRHKEIQYDTDMRIASALKAQAKSMFLERLMERYHLPLLLLASGLILHLGLLLKDGTYAWWMIIPSSFALALIFGQAVRATEKIKGYKAAYRPLSTKQDNRRALIVGFWFLTFILVQRNLVEVTFGAPVLLMIIGLSLIVIGKGDVANKHSEPALNAELCPSDNISDKHLVMLASNPVIKKWMLDVLDRRENLTYTRLAADRAHIANRVNEKLIRARNSHVRNLIEK